MARVQYDDVTTTPFTSNGSPATVDDQHNPASALDYDSAVDWSSSTATPFTNGSTKGTFSFWINWDGSSGHMISQRPTGSPAKFIWYMSVATNGQLSLSYEATDATNAGIVSNSATGVLVASTWTHLTGVMDLTNAAEKAHIFKSGAEVSYAVKDNVLGTPGVTMVDPGTLSLMSANSNAATLLPGGIFSRPTFFDNEVRSDANILTEFNNEFAAIGEGFPSGLIGGQGRPNFRLDMIRNTRYNKGLARFSR